MDMIRIEKIYVGFFDSLKDLSGAYLKPKRKVQKKYPQNTYKRQIEVTEGEEEAVNGAVLGEKQSKSQFASSDQE